MQDLRRLAYHPVFDAPLELAIKLGKEVVVEAILENIPSIPEDKKKTKHRYDLNLNQEFDFGTIPGIINQAVCAAICHDNEDLLNLLINWYKDQGLTFFKDEYNNFLRTAINKSSLAIVQMVFLIPYPKHCSSKEVTWAIFKIACARGRAHVVKLFLDDGYIGGNDKASATSPLFEAVASGCLAVLHCQFCATLRTYQPCSASPQERYGTSDAGPTGHSAVVGLAEWMGPSLWARVGFEVEEGCRRGVWW
jgi:hypothetical protein